MIQFGEVKMESSVKCYNRSRGRGDRSVLCRQPTFLKRFASERSFFSFWVRNGCVFIVEGQTFPIAIWPKPRSMPNSDRCFRHNNDKGFDLRAHFEVKAFSNGPHELGRRPNVTYGRHPLLLFLTFLSQCLHVAYFGSAILLSKWAQTGEMYLVALSGILRC